MVFITHLFANSKKLLFVLIISLLLSPMAAAESVSATRATANITADGRLSISSRFKIVLPDQLKNVLKQGVPLYFTLDYRLSSPKLTAYKLRLNQLLSQNEHIAYKLSFHPLTNRYRVTIGSFATEYSNADTALRSIGAVANWRVLPAETLNQTPIQEVAAEVRLSLSTTHLPKPFQINTPSESWRLDSQWQKLEIRK